LRPGLGDKTADTQTVKEKPDCVPGRIFNILKKEVNIDFGRVDDYSVIALYAEFDSARCARCLSRPSECATVVPLIEDVRNKRRLTDEEVQPQPTAFETRREGWLTPLPIAYYSPS